MTLNSFKDKTNAELIEYLSVKIRAERNKLKLSQKDFAELAGIPLRTYKRFEQSCDGSIENLINVLRVFDKVGFFQSIFPTTNLQKRPTVIDRFEEIRRKSQSRD